MRGHEQPDQGNARTIATPLPKVPERLIQRRRTKAAHDLGEYALAVKEGRAGDGDIFPDKDDVDDIAEIIPAQSDIHPMSVNGILRHVAAQNKGVR